MTCGMQGVTKCMQRTIPYQVKCSTTLTEIDESCQLISFPDPSINFMLYSVFEVGSVCRVDEIVVYMYVGSVG